MTSKLKLLIMIITIAVVIVLITFLIMYIFPLLTSEKRIEFTVNFVTNILGTVVGAGLAFFFAVRQFNIQTSKEKKDSAIDLTLKFHERFNSTEMFEARGRADKLILENHSESYAALYDKLPEEQTRCVFLVTRFYEQLWYSIKHDKVDLKLVPDFFGEIFFWWYLVSFKHQLLQLDWQVCRNIEFLKEWFEINSNKNDLEDWSMRAKKDRKRRIKGSKR